MKRKFHLKTVRTGILIAITCAALLLAVPARKAGERFEQFWQVEAPSDPIVRIHVLANSNHPADQQFKMKVAEQVRYLLADGWSRTAGLDFLAFLRENLPVLERQLQLYASSSASPGPAITMELVKAEFPLRAYARKVYAAGEYQALKVIIGEGKGENWWCLLFPPLCLPLAEIEPGDHEEQVSGSAGIFAFGESDNPHRKIKADQPPPQKQNQRWRLKIWEWIGAR